MKIIIKDNFARENISDELYKENVSKEDGEKTVVRLNINPNSSDYYVLVEDDYELYNASKIY